MFFKFKQVSWIAAMIAIIALTSSLAVASAANLDVQSGANQQDDDTTTQPFLGIVVGDTDEGVYIRAVEPESPAATAGLEVADIVIGINDETIESSAQLVEFVQDQAPGDTITVVVLREEAEATFEVVLGEREVVERGPNRDFDVEVMPGERFPGGRMSRGTDRLQLGVSFRSLTPEIAASEGLTVEAGALVTGVVSGSPAEDAGLQEGDIIVAVDGDVIDIERTLSDRLYAYEAEDRVMLTVVREGEDLEIGVVLANSHPNRQGLNRNQQNNRGDRMRDRDFDRNFPGMNDDFLEDFDGRFGAEFFERFPGITQSS